MSDLPTARPTGPFNEILVYMPPDESEGAVIASAVSMARLFAAHIDGVIAVEQSGGRQGAYENSPSPLEIVAVFENRARPCLGVQAEASLALLVSRDTVISDEHSTMMSLAVQWLKNQAAECGSGACGLARNFSRPTFQPPALLLVSICYAGAPSRSVPCKGPAATTCWLRSGGLADRPCNGDSLPSSRGFSDAETAIFMDIDFDKHVALVALLDEDGRPAIVGAGRYILNADGEAELAFLVIDAYQEQSIGRLLLKHLVAIAEQRACALTAEVLPENAAMLRPFKDFGFKTMPQREFSAVHLVRVLR